MLPPLGSCSVSVLFTPSKCQHFQTVLQLSVVVPVSLHRATFPSHCIEPQPNECCDLELALTGGKPGSSTLSLLCHIEHHPEPVTLHVEAAFKGPQVCIDLPSLDLGLMKLGDSALSTIQLNNISQLAASWSLQECPSDQPEVSQLVIDPCSEMLPPLGSCSVSVLFTPSKCQHFQTVLQLSVENGAGCHLAVQADIQKPRVCLQTCELVFQEIYLGVPVWGTVNLLNQTMLPAKYSWGELIGKQASQCSATVFPSSGIVGPKETEQMSVEFTAHTESELTDTALLCSVTSMEEPLVLEIFGKASGLHVTFSVPSDSPEQEWQDPSKLLLDFGAQLLNSKVKQQLIITNHTAIPAPFSVEAEYFCGRLPSPPADSARSSRAALSGVIIIFHCALTELEAALLSHGKGAVFFIEPSTGTLGPFQKQTIEITAFANMWGEYWDNLICRAGELDPVTIPMQISVKGCPLYFQMTGPQRDSQTHGPIVRFGTHISGGDTVSRSLRINNPSPYTIRMDWETLNQEKGDSKLVDLLVLYGDAFPLKDADRNEVIGGRVGSCESRKQKWDWDTLPSTAGTSSSMRTDHEEEEEGEEGEQGELEEVNKAQLKKIISVNLQAHEGTISDYPYCITPRQILVPAGGSATLHVSFTPLTLSEIVSETECAGFALGFLSLDSKVAGCIPGKVERAQGYELEPLRLDLHAFVKPALLTLELEDEEEEEEGVVFYASASDLVPRDPHTKILLESVTTRRLRLLNRTETPLYFRLLAPEPFSVLHVEPWASMETSHSDREEEGGLVLHPQHNMQLVPAGGSATLHVSFTPLTLSEIVSETECAGFALGFLSLDSKVAGCIPGKVERAQGYELEPLRLDLHAFVKPALLTLELEDEEEEEEGVVFYASASDLVPRDPHTKILLESVTTRRLRLLNRTETPLYFRLLAPEPFSVLHVEPWASMETSHSDREEEGGLVLHPQHNMQVTVAFRNSLTLLTYQNQPENQLPRGAELIQSETGERKLRFSQQLVVEYSNKSAQLIPLCAHLTVPVLQLSPHSLDFGTCYVGQTRVQEVFLSNTGGSNSYWTALIDHGETPGVFAVSPHSGTLDAHIVHISASRVALQISFTAGDSTEYKAMLTVHGMLGEQTVRLEVRGRGSHDERFESLLTDTC
ncbi:UNVERIFIED_CONTAM: hypothetical protein FKN15_053519 [Acipenser sinensis]